MEFNPIAGIREVQQVKGRSTANGGWPAVFDLENTTPTGDDSHSRSGEQDEQSSSNPDQDEFQQSQDEFQQSETEVEGEPELAAEAEPDRAELSAQENASEPPSLNFFA